MFAYSEKVSIFITESIILLKEFLETFILKKKSAQDKKACNISEHAKELMLRVPPELMLRVPLEFML